MDNNIPAITKLVKRTEIALRFSSHYNCSEPWGVFMLHNAAAYWMFTLKQKLWWTWIDSETLMLTTGWVSLLCLELIRYLPSIWCFSAHVHLLYMKTATCKYSCFLLACRACKLLRKTRRNDAIIHARHLEFVTDLCTLLVARHFSPHTCCWPCGGHNVPHAYKLFLPLMHTEVHTVLSDLPSYHHCLATRTFICTPTPTRRLLIQRHCSGPTCANIYGMQAAFKPLQTWDTNMFRDS